VPGFVTPDVNSKDHLVVVATWIQMMRDYFVLFGDEPRYEFEVTGADVSEAEADDSEGIVY